MVSGSVYYRFRQGGSSGVTSTAAQEPTEKRVAFTDGSVVGAITRDFLAAAIGVVMAPPGSRWGADGGLLAKLIASALAGGPPAQTNSARGWLCKCKLALGLHAFGVAPFNPWA